MGSASHLSKLVVLLWACVLVGGVDYIVRDSARVVLQCPRPEGRRCGPGECDQIATFILWKKTNDRAQIYKEIDGTRVINSSRGLLHLEKENPDFRLLNNGNLEVTRISQKWVGEYTCTVILKDGTEWKGTVRVKVVEEIKEEDVERSYVVERNGTVTLECPPDPRVTHCYYGDWLPCEPPQQPAGPAVRVIWILDGRVESKIVEQTTTNGETITTPSELFYRHTDRYKVLEDGRLQFKGIPGEFQGRYTCSVQYRRSSRAGRVCLDVDKYGHDGFCSRAPELQPSTGLSTIHTAVIGAGAAAVFVALVVGIACWAVRKHRRNQRLQSQDPSTPSSIYGKQLNQPSNQTTPISPRIAGIPKRRNDPLPAPPTLPRPDEKETPGTPDSGISSGLGGPQPFPAETQAPRPGGPSPFAGEDDTEPPYISGPTGDAHHYDDLPHGSVDSSDIGSSQLNQPRVRNNEQPHPDVTYVNEHTHPDPTYLQVF